MQERTDTLQSVHVRSPDQEHLVAGCSCSIFSMHLFSWAKHSPLRIEFRRVEQRAPCNAWLVGSLKKGERTLFAPIHRPLVSTGDCYSLIQLPDVVAEEASMPPSSHANPVSISNQSIL